MDEKTQITKASTRPIASILQDTLNTHSDVLFAKAFSEITKGPFEDPAKPLTLKEFLAETREHWSLPALPTSLSLSSLIKQSARFLLKTAGKIVSYPISQKDIRLYARGEDSKSIFLHRPMVVWCQVILSWVSKVLTTASQSPKLSEKDREVLNKTLSAISDFNQGFQSGVTSKETHLRLLRTLKVLRRSKSFDLGMDARVFETLERNLSIYFQEQK